MSKLKFMDLFSELDDIAKPKEPFFANALLILFKLIIS